MGTDTSNVAFLPAAFHENDRLVRDYDENSLLATTKFWLESLPLLSNLGQFSQVVVARFLEGDRCKQSGQAGTPSYRAVSTLRKLATSWRSSIIPASTENAVLHS